ncbi:hypothetical protein DFJ77DRAFT_5872 [Powellomyces hirtus]|nr:hypothetical protein DFJ77DRAFT_5872 [Powellomyces hirtus]
MGKAGKERKRRRLETTHPAHPVTKVPALEASDSGDDEGLTTHEDGISSSALAVTVATLTALESQPALLRSKQCKALRIALHRLNAASTQAGVGGGTTLVGRVSDALTDGRWGDAMRLLEEMRERGVVPKLGALQRWVRDCDAVGSAEGGLDGAEEVLRVLDAVLRTSDPEMVPKPTGEDEGVVQRHPPWAPCPRRTDPTVRLDAETDYKSQFRVVSFEKGAERRTPNLHDFIMYTSVPGTIAHASESAPSVTRQNVPHVPGAFLLTDVLTPAQCTQILSATENVGFMPDAPIGSGAAAEQISVLAHNMFWLADDDILSMIFERCRPHLPPVVAPNCELRGLNSRWRVYRYVPGAVYRPHIDGAWPGSGLDPVTGNYEYDLYKDRRSKLTFLVYLNDDFEGGSTTFFTPAARTGTLDAWPVTPRTGSVLCFPHGDAKGALLHEGSRVTQGTKYIIRADVLYSLPKDAEKL